MATYLILNLVYIAIVGVIAGIKLGRPSKAIIVTLIILIVMTAIFDNLIVGLSIVNYDPAKILDIRIGVAPIEDFMYPLLAIVLVPVIWRRIEKHDA